MLGQKGVKLVWGKWSSYICRLLGNCSWHRALKPRLALPLSRQNIKVYREEIIAIGLTPSSASNLPSFCGSRNSNPGFLRFFPVFLFLVSLHFLCLPPPLSSYHKSSLGPSHLGLQNSVLPTQLKSFMQFLSQMRWLTFPWDWAVRLSQNWGGTELDENTSLLSVNENVEVGTSTSLGELSSIHACHRSPWRWQRPWHFLNHCLKEIICIYFKQLWWSNHPIQSSQVMGKPKYVSLMGQRKVPG